VPASVVGVDYAAALLEQNESFGEMIRDADPSTPVPTCPGWTLRQLMRHVGRGDRWAAQIIDDRCSQALDPRAVREGKPPDDLAGAIAWLHGSPRALIAAVERAGADTQVWTFLGPQPAAWWIRRRLHEAAVHRADAAIALGLDYRLSAELSADAISEWLERVVADAGSPLSDGQALHLHATDAGEHWLLRDGDNALTLTHEDHEDREKHQDEAASAGVSGPATGLLLALVRRWSAQQAGLRLSGDTGVWQTWLDRTPF
jgi:uncharacterized protein (TIGR03083 family)